MYSSQSSQSSIGFSSTSRETSMTGNAEEMRFEQWRESFFFPLFTEISRRGHLPKIIYVIQIIIIFLQEAGVTMWCGSRLINSNSFLRTIYYFTDWNILRTHDFKDCIIQYSIGLGLFLFTNLFLIFVSIYYHYKRIFLNSQIIILRFLLYPLLDSLLPFYSCLVARSFVEICSGESNSLSISFFVISIIILIISIIELKFSKQFSTNTPVLDRSLIASWDDEFLFLTFFSISYGSLLSTILDMFPKWLHVIAILSYAILVWYRIYMLYFIPMLRFYVNSIFSGICIMCNFNLLFSLIHLFTDSIPFYVYFVLALLSFIGGIIFSTFWFEKKKKNRLDLLSYKSIQQQDDEDLNEQNIDKLAHDHFDKIIFSSARDAISYIHIGVAYHADLLIDITFLRYLMENYAEPSIIFAVSQVASFLASYPQFLSYCLSIVTRIPDLSISQSYLLYQIRRIHVVRQSSVSTDASNQLLILQKMSRETISQVRGFWSEIMNAKADISFASLQYLRKITLKTESAFIDARDRFPNNVSILNEYCRFQIEGMGDFSGAINSGKKILQLNQGENLMIDHAFRSLVNVYPNYLLKNIMNSRGDLLKKDIMTSDSFESVSSITTTSFSSYSTNSSSSSQIEFEEKYEEIISNLYDHGKLRIALQSRMKSTRLNSLTIAQTWSLAQLLCCIFVYLTLIIYAPTLCHIPNYIIECAHYVSQMTLSMYHISSISAIQHVISLRDFSGVTVLKQLLGIKNVDLNKEPSLMEKPFLLMKNIVNSLKSEYDHVVQLLMGPLSSYTEDFPSFYEENDFYRIEQNATINISLRSSITFFISDAEIVASYNDNPSNSKTQKMIELMINIKTVSQKLKELQDSMCSVGELSISNLRKTFFLVAILIIAVCFTVFGLFRIFNIVSIFKQAKNCSDVLRKTNSDQIKQSFMPISKMGNKEAICGNNVHNAHEINIWLIMYPIVVVLSILIAFTFVLSSNVIFTTELSKTKHVFDFLYAGTVRYMALLDSLITFCLNSADIVSFDVADKILKNSIELIKSSQELIDLNLMGIDNEIDSFYFVQNCSRSGFIDDFAEYIKCLSIDNKINVAYSSILIFSHQNNTKKLNDHNFASLVFIVDMFLTKDLVKFQDLLVHYSDKLFASAKFYLISLSIIGLLISCLVFLIEHLFSRTFIQSVDAIKQLIAMLPPISVVSSSFLMNFLNSNSKSGKFESLKSAPDSIISETTTASILVDQNCLIQAVNTAVNTTTGFTPDQILGQKIEWLIPNPSSEGDGLNADILINSKFYAAIDNMLDYHLQNTKNNNINFDANQSNKENFDVEIKIDANSVVEENEEEEEKEEPYLILKTKCLTENGSLIPTKTTILRLNEEPKGSTQIVLFLRDLSKEEEIEKELQKAKTMTQHLLKSIIPREIEDLSTEFTSNMATVIFIEISGLTDYVHTMSPQTLMNNLKTIYESFDKRTKDFPLVSIVKTEAEVVVACCGLFNHVGEIGHQVEQSVLYCKKMIDDIDAINEELDIDLHLRVAINVGGPVLGKMLNLKTPSFEIVGNFIELAQRMAIDGDQNVIQVGESVLQYLENGKFEVEKGIDLVNLQSGTTDQTYVVKNVVI